MTLQRILSAAALVLVTAPVWAEAPTWIEKAVPAPLAYSDFTAPEADLDALIAHGRLLFEAKFTRLDGAGRPMATQAIVPTKRRRPAAHEFQRMSGPDANSCASCHNDPVTGGAGAFTANAFVSEGFTHADFDTLDPQFSNERGTTALHGAGLIELLAREMTAELHAQRDAAVSKAYDTGSVVRTDLAAKGVSFGRLTADRDGTLDLSEIDGVDADLVIRPFSQKGVMTSLRQFTVNALNHHHGIQPEERFGAAWTGEADFDEDGIADEMTPGDISALVAFQAALAIPERRVPDDAAWRAAAKRGETVFGTIGCAACHRPTLPLDGLRFTDPGPYDAAGTLRAEEVVAPIALNLATQRWAAALPRDDQGRVLVPLFGDLKRHKIADPRRDTLGNELLSQRFVERDVFLTAELWGIGSTAPYGHRGDLTTLDEAIRAHGGDATESRKAYEGLVESNRSAVIAFLKTLTINPLDVEQ